MKEINSMHNPIKLRVIKSETHAALLVRPSKTNCVTANMGQNEWSLASDIHY